MLQVVDVSNAASNSVHSFPAGGEFPLPQIIHSTGKKQSNFSSEHEWETMNPGWRMNELTTPEQLSVTEAPGA